MDNSLPSVTSNQAVSLPTRDSLAHCPVAQRLYDRTGGADGIPLGAVAVVNSTDTSVATAADSVRHVGVSVTRFSKEFGDRTLAALVLTHLTLVEDMANVARPMKPEAMAMLAKKVTAMLLEEDVTVTLADLQIVADRMVNGDAGNIYGGLNSQIVTKAFTDYICEKANAFADWRQEQAREHSFGSFGSDRSKESARLKDQQAMKLYLDGTLNKDLKTD